MSDEIIIAIIGACGVIVTALLGFLATLKQKSKTLRAEDEMRLESEALSFDQFFNNIGSLQDELSDLFSSSNFDRFLMLRATNGEFKPKWTSAIWQYRRGHQDPIQYVYTQLDEDYVERLRQTVQHGVLQMKTDELPDSLIKSIYKNEGVEDAVWFHISSQQVIGTKRRCLTYCSFATSESGMSDCDITRARMIVNRLAVIAHAVERIDPVLSTTNRLRDHARKEFALVEGFA